MVVMTTRFGEIDVEPACMLHLPEGLLGFEDIRTYCLLEHAPGSPFLWLQATADPNLAFVVLNPFDFCTDYEVDLSDADVERLRVSDAGDVRVYTVVTIADDLVTVNLMGPIVVNGGNQLAKQIVLNDARYTTRHTIARLPVCA